MSKKLSEKMQVLELYSKPASYKFSDEVENNWEYFCEREYKISAVIKDVLLSGIIKRSNN